ncbi:MAG: ABC transporter substrate-binding protein [Lachnospiraceae bacterium]
MKKTGKLVSLVLAVAMTATLLAGCGGGNSGETTDTGAKGDGNESGAAVESGGKLKDTIVFAQSADVTSLDPHAIVNMRSFDVYGNIFEGLVDLDEKNQIVPALAESWERIDDKAMRFKLRQGVKFHDGSTMTAEDVKYSFERMINSKIVSTYVGFLESVEIEDENTVILHCSEPYSQMLITLTIPCCAIVPKAIVEADEEGFGKKPIGTGPYKFTEWKESESVTMQAFNDYWGEPAKTTNLIMKVVPEGSPRTIMLETGEIDVAYDVLANDASRIEEDKNLELMHQVGQKFSVIYFKADSKSPVGNPKVRQAIQYAVNKEELLQAIKAGYGQLGQLYATPNTVGYDAAKDGSEYNQEKAKQLLTEAGYPNGFDLSIYTTEGQSYVETAQILQAQLQEVGINSTITTLEQNTLNQKVYDGEDIQMRINFYNNLAGDMDFVMSKLVTSAYGQTYFNDEVDKLQLKARAEFDDTKKNAVYGEFLDLMAQDMPWMTLYYEENLVGVSNKIQNFTMSNIGAYKYKNVTITE